MVFALKRSTKNVQRSVQYACRLHTVGRAVSGRPHRTFEERDEDRSHVGEYLLGFGRTEGPGTLARRKIFCGEKNGIREAEMARAEKPHAVR